jgi:hypothetical protein
MIAVRRLHRQDWERKLKGYGCYPAAGLTRLNTAEWWRWPWGGPPFTVPIDDDGCCDTRAFHKLVADMALLAPEGWEFPDMLDF